MNTQLNVSSGSIEGKKETLVKDLKGIVADADTLLKDVASSTAEEFAAARTKVEGRLGEARYRLAKTRSRITEKAKTAAGTTNQFVRENPWKAIGVAAAAGLIASYFLKRR